MAKIEKDTKKPAAAKDEKVKAKDENKTADEPKQPAQPTAPPPPEPEPAPKKAGEKKDDGDEVVPVCFPHFANTFQVFDGVGVHFDRQGKARTFRRLIPIIKDLVKDK